MKEFSHLSAKDHISKARKSGSDGERGSNVIVSPEMTELEIEDSIRQDLLALSSRHPKQSWEDLLSDQNDSSEEQLLMILIDQNKILIRQNELILRSINRKLSNSPPKHPEISRDVST
jgi:hypothetical protein